MALRLKIDILRTKTVVTQEYDCSMVGRHIPDHVLQRQLIEKLTEHRHRHSKMRRQIVFIHRYRIREQARIAAHQQIQQSCHSGVRKFYVIEVIPVHDDLHSRIDVYVFREGPMASPVKIDNRVVYRRILQFEMLAELFKFELQLTACACIIWDIVEDMDLVIHILNVLKRRERCCSDLVHALDVHSVPKKDCITAFSVTSASAGFLEICLWAIRHIEVHHKADIRLVDAHSERIRTCHHTHISRFPLFLALSPDSRSQTGVIEGCRNPIRGQERRQFFSLFSAAHIHDSCAVDSVADVQKLTEFILAFTYYIRKVRSLETALYQAFALKSKAFHDVIRHLRSGSSRKGYHRGIHQFTELAYLQIIRTEIISPLGDAVSLINDDVADIHFAHIAFEKRCRQTLRRDIQELVVAIQGIVQCSVYLAAAHAGIDAQCADAAVVQILHLILHEGDQRGHDDRYPLPHQSRHLEAHGFTASGRENGKHIPVLQRSVYYVFLHRTEGVVPPIFLKCILCCHVCANPLSFVCKSTKIVVSAYCGITKNSYFCVDKYDRVKP